MITTWATIHHFKPEDFERPDDIDPILVYAVDELREYVNVPIVVHSGIFDGHDPLGEHPRGKAVDCHAVGLNLIDFWLAAERFAIFGGIGLYPWWEHPGLHLDVRLQTHRARWMRLSDKTYVPLNRARLEEALKCV